jgi:hypothetical protein
VHLFWSGKQCPFGAILDLLKRSMSQLFDELRMALVGCRLSKLCSISPRWTWILNMGIHHLGPFWPSNQHPLSTISDSFERSLSWLSNKLRIAPFGCHLRKLWSIYPRWIRITIMSIHNWAILIRQATFIWHNFLFIWKINESTFQRAKYGSIRTSFEQVVINLPRVDPNYHYRH